MSGLVMRAAMVAAAVVGFGAWAAPASAQATRTWVSGVGDDVNPCSRTAPCKTFAGAISKTATGGEISCLDPAGYGSVTITKSLSIVCDATDASILASGTNGITVNGAGIVVYLSGLNIFAVNSPAAANDGVVVLNAGSVVLDNVKIRNFGGFGIRAEQTATGALTIKNVLLANNGTVGTSLSGALFVRPTAGTSATATITGTTIANNANIGIRMESQAGSTVAATVADTMVSNSGTGVLFRTLSTGAFNASVNGVTLTNNSFGLVSNGAGVALRVGDSTITANTTGVASFAGGTTTSFGDNRLAGNGTNGTFTTVVAKQ